MRLHEGHGDERGGPGREYKAVRRVPAQRVPLGTYRRGLNQMFDCQQRSAEQTAEAARQQRSSRWGAGLLLCETDGTRDARETRRDTTAGLPPARALSVLTETGERKCC